MSVKIIKIDSDVEEMILANVKAKLSHLKCVAADGVYRSLLNELIKDVNNAFDKVAAKTSSDNAGCL